MRDTPSSPRVPKSLRVAFYARVSSQQQADANTIASQVEALKTRMRSDGFRLEEELCFLDEGYSGSTLFRPALERLRDQAAACSFDRLYVHSPDRLARTYAYQVLLVDELQRHGVEIVFLNRDIRQSPEDNLLLQMQGMMAEYERAKIVERSQRGKQHAAQAGSVNVLSGAPYGYRYLSKYEGGGQEHRVEECLQRAKGEAGLADYEVRNWRGWHHHQTLALMATWFLTQQCQRGEKKDAVVDGPTGPHDDWPALATSPGVLEPRGDLPRRHPPASTHRSRSNVSLPTTPRARTQTICAT